MRNEVMGVMIKMMTMTMTIAVTVSLTLASFSTVSAVDVRPGKGPAVLADALAVLRVNDPRLLDRETTQFAAGLGINPEPLRAALAHLLYRSRNLDGIDLSRPAMMAWRPTSPSLLAVIPLTDRRTFLENFGAGYGEEAPLIRVGERDGTVVYTQNGNDGLLEYRLLVSDRAAYLASTTAACRELAGFPLQLATNDPPLVFTANAAFLSSLGSSAEGSLNYRKLTQILPPGMASAQAVARASWDALLGQLSNIEFSLRPDQQNNMNVTLRMQAIPESALAIWSANQRNQPSRLLSLVRSEHAVVTLAGSIMWQGQAERLGKMIEPALKQIFEERWTATVEENWTALWNLVDRAGPFAMAADLSSKDGKPVSESRYIGDQPKAQELMSLIAMVMQNLTGITSEAVTAGNATGYHEQRPDGDTVLVSNERFLVSVQSSMRSAVTAATDLVTRSQTNGPLEGNPGVLQMSANLTPLVRTMVVALGGQLQAILPEAVCSLTIKVGVPGSLVAEGAFPAVKVGVPGSLVAEGAFPAAAVALLVRDSGLLQMIAPASTAKPPAKGAN